MSADPIQHTKIHYAWIIAGVTFLVLLATAGVRATPSVLIVPLEREFGWTRATISGAVAVNIALFGIIGPFAASLMNRFGLRKVVLAAVGLLAIAVAASSLIRQSWQLFLCWGVLVGAGTGVTSLVLAAIVVNRWFEQRRNGTHEGPCFILAGAGMCNGVRILHHLSANTGARQHALGRISRTRLPRVQTGRGRKVRFHLRGEGAGAGHNSHIEWIQCACGT